MERNVLTERPTSSISKESILSSSVGVRGRRSGVGPLRVLIRHSMTQSAICSGDRPRSCISRAISRSQSRSMSHLLLQLFDLFVHLQYNSNKSVEQRRNVSDVV